MNAPTRIVEAFVRGGLSIPQEMIWRTLTPLLPGGPLTILDIGGDDAAMAVRWAAVGHQVTVIIHDPHMLARTAARLSRIPAAIAERIRLIEGGVAAVAGAGPYGLVCCHDVLMYEDAPTPLIDAAVQACAPGGLISIVAVNPAAIAMRPGLAGRWREAQIALGAPGHDSARYAPGCRPSREEMCRTLAACGADPIGWSGIGIFTDHHDDPIDADDPRELLQAEWLAGRCDPYRGVARCYHIVARPRARD